MRDAASIDGLAARIRACRICVERPEGAPLSHEPRPVVVLSRTARIAICGQAPGTRVHATGIPFNDPSGDRLRQWMDVGRDAFYDASRFAIVPMGFCFPGLDRHGGDLPPRRECRRNWHDPVFAAMSQLTLFLLIGGHAQRYHLGKRAKGTVTQTVACWREYIEPDALGRRYLALPHPSWRNTGWLKKNPWFENELLPVLRALIQDPDG